MDNHIIIAILVPVFTAAIGYIIKARKRGDKCIGCPHSHNCGKKKTKDCECDE